LVALALIGLDGSAWARDAYVANSGDGTVSVLNLATNASIGTVTVGAKPVDLAITPNGKFAYVANEGGDSVSVTNRTVVKTIAVGDAPRGVAVSPDGRTVWVTDSGDDDVMTIDTATNTVSGLPISLPSGAQPEGIAIAPDGLHALVAQKGGDVSIVDTASRAIVATAADPSSSAPARIAVGPRGGRAFVTDSGSNTVTAFNPDNGALAGSPIPIGTNPSPIPAGIAIAPNGGFAYATGSGDGTLTPIATSNNAAGTPIASFSAPLGVAIAPDGKLGYVTNSGSDLVSGFNTATNGLFGPLPAGATPSGIAIVPDQGPTASLFVTPAVRMVNRNVTFDAGASRDPDGTIANFAWSFGDGKTAKGRSSTRRHKYRRPGTYSVTLTATDDEGCSTDLVFTGQTASCNGSAVATLTRTIVVFDDRAPVLRLLGPGRQRLGRRVSVSALCPVESCRAHAGGDVVTVLKLRHGRRVMRVVRRLDRLVPTGTRLPAGIGRVLDLRLPPRTRRAAARALRSGGSATARLTVTAVDATGLKTTRRRTIRLFGPKPPPR
jgi:YVTN family beta-propeller protein